MSFWRNPEIKRQGMWYLAAAVGFTAAAWFFMKLLLAEATVWLTFRACTAAAGLVLAAVAGSAVIHFATTKKRYDDLRELAGQLDQFLHGQWELTFAEHREGELSILQDEIRKMTGTLRQQADALKGEKEYLCDAITDLSHQLRTPLTSLNLIQTMLSEQQLPETRRRELLRRQKQLLHSVDSLLVTLLKMARIDAGAVTFEKKSVSVTELTEKAAEPLRIPMEIKGQQLILSSASVDGEVHFCGDLAWSTEALTNILKNCMEHTPEKGHIVVSWQENAVYTEVCVEDDGPGIAPEDLPYILERFYKGKNQGSAGFGVGLAFARMVTAAQNGVLTVENRQEGGARFRMRFYKGIV